MNKNLRYPLVIFLSAVLVFSLVRLVQVQLEYRAGNDIYDQATVKFISSRGDPTNSNIYYEPAEEPEQNGTEDSSGLPVIKSVEDMAVDFSQLKRINSEVIGWLVIENSVISYPLMLGKDNDKYLYTTYNGVYNRQGSIFMDCANSGDLSNRNTVIYGHNMRNGSMFGTLKQYARQSYFESHRYFYILTETGTLKYEVLSAYTADVDSNTFQKVFATEESFAGFMEDISARSQISSGIDTDTAAMVVTLSTCTANSSDTKRFVVHGKLVEYKELAESKDM